MEKEKIAVGVDLGGTSIKIGLVNQLGKIKKKISIDSLAADGPKRVVSQIIAGIYKLLDGQKIKIEGIGIGSPGIIITEKGIVADPPNFPGWKKVPLGKLIAEEFNKKVVVENDANAAAIGELIYGAGKKLNYFIMITLGTGVGGGIIINKKIYRGETGGAGEIGHSSIDYNGPLCKCGSKGCIETYIGNSYLVNNVKQQLPDHPHSLIAKMLQDPNTQLSPKLISDAASMNDEFALSIIENAGEKLGYGLASVINIFDITNVIIGGGVAGFGKPLFNAVEKAIKSRVMIPFKSRVKVIPAKLRNDAGIKGASALVFYKSS
ncbi:ROK family protein [Melioribacteraceae bacterium 4301-Me]|uniref:ROK family protein n=1 Tax=Pyranulibacter aquaticus TaxID=3163344 RepID=UPI00359B1ED3